MTAGEKFADADLIGLPYRVTVSQKTFAKGQFELKSRVEKDTKFINNDEVINIVAAANTN
jgi:prolyl-tRNA synthetase